MKIKHILISILIIVCACLSSCKNSDSKRFSLKGCIVESPQNRSITIYSKPEDGDIVGKASSDTLLEILDHDELKLKVQYEERGKKMTGWVYMSDVRQNRDIFFRILEPALNGDTLASTMMVSEYNDLTFEDAMKALNTIISVTGKERFQKLDPESYADKPVFKSLRVVLNPEIGKDIPNYTTRQIHILADCANKATLEKFHLLLKNDYIEKFCDSQGRSCHMRAVDQENLDALMFYDENNISENPEADYHKDNKGNTLETYVMRCQKGPVYNFMNSVLMTSEKNINAFYEHLEQNQVKQNFKMINLLFDPVPFTQWREEHPDAETAFVFMFDDKEPEWHFIDYNGTLNLRDNFGTSSKVIGKLYYGNQVWIQERSPEKSEIDGVSDYWYKVASKDDEGWCWGGYLVYPEKVQHAKYAKGEGPVTTYTQTDFDENTKTTVIDDTDIIMIDGTRCPVKAFEDVTVLKKLYDWEHKDLWDYGEPDANLWESVYCPRYNYYLVRNKNFETGILGGSHIVHERLEEKYNLDSHKCDFSFYVNYLIREDDYSDENYQDEDSPYYAEIFEARKGKIRKLNPAFELWNEPKPVDFETPIEKRKIYLIDYCEYDAEFRYYHQPDGNTILHMYSIILQSSGATKEGLYSNYNVCTVLDIEGKCWMFDSLSTCMEENPGETEFDSSGCNFITDDNGGAPELRLEAFGKYIDRAYYEKNSFEGTYNVQDYSRVFNYIQNDQLCFVPDEE